MHRVGIIPFAIEEAAVRLLFVTSQRRSRWVLPKGKAKLGETHAETGHREGFEEAGVTGVVLENFPMTVVVGRQEVDEIVIMPVTFYPYLVLELSESWPEQDRRERRWMTLDEALVTADPDDYRAVIEQFCSLQPWIMATVDLIEQPENGD